MVSLSNHLIVVPLINEVLLPSAIIKITLHGKYAASLAKNYQDSIKQQHPLHIACIPLIPSNDHSPNGDLFDYGCVAQVLDIDKTSMDVYTLCIEGISRFRVIGVKKLNAWVAHVEYIKAQGLNDQEESIVQFRRLVRRFLEAIIELHIPNSLIDNLSQRLYSCSHSDMADLMATVIEATFEEKLVMLSTASLKKRIEMTSEWVWRQINAIKLLDQLETDLGHEGICGSEQSEEEREGPFENVIDGAEAILNKPLSENKLPHEVKNVIQKELQRLQKTDPRSSEYQISKSYVETLIDLPWDKKKENIIDIQAVQKILDENHHGLNHVKKRIVEYLSVLKVKRDFKAPILCFLGPPGVGKTTLGKSIATSLDRGFHQISLGGVQDEADIKGHRRTYVESMPGLIIQGLRKCKTNNPLFLLDEIDKLGHSMSRGSPADTLLEILDPEQNSNFLDHYLSIPFDLSNILFIATANKIENIPKSLLDRMEIIPFSGYTFDEKLSIAKSRLLPTQLKAHGLAEKNFKVSDETLLEVAESYTKESGVRSFEKAIASMVRGKCAEWAHEDKLIPYTPYVTTADLRKLLGIPLYEKEIAVRETVPGVAAGIACSSKGQGGILLVESTKLPGNGQLVITGLLSDTIKETARLAFTWVKSHAYRLKLTESTESDILYRYDIHTHIHENIIPKDGPSIGLTLVASLVSLFSGYCIPPTTAIVGEISLRGKILPISGVKEKIVSAHRSGILKIILPLGNYKNIEQDVPEKLKKEIEFVYAKTVWDALEVSLVFNGLHTWKARFSESRL
ncbi:ATP-dependent protease La [Sporodiniella umbellata]|nr:ATP-dependent protease La [Sporodiniella umbellata]